MSGALYLDEYGTDLQCFVTWMLALKRRRPEAYEVLRRVMRAMVGDDVLDAAGRAQLVAAFRVLVPDNAKARRLVEFLERDLAEGAPS